MGNIKCCQHCVPPKRHGGCHSNCPEYIKERAALDEENRELRKETSVKNYFQVRALENMARYCKTKYHIKGMED